MCWRKIWVIWGKEGAWRGKERGGVWVVRKGEVEFFLGRENEWEKIWAWFWISFLGLNNGLRGLFMDKFVTRP